LDHHVDEVRLNTLSDRAIEKINATHPQKITVLKTVDLGDTRFDALPAVPAVFETFG